MKKIIHWIGMHPFWAAMLSAVLLASDLVLWITVIEGKLESRPAIYFLIPGSVLLALYILLVVLSFIFSGTIDLLLNNLSKKSRQASRLIKDQGYRTILGGYLSLIGNVFMVLLRFSSWLIFNSVWSAVLSFYYLIFGAAKVRLLFRLIKTRSISDPAARERIEWRKVFNSGFIMLLLSLVFLFIMGMTTRHMRDTTDLGFYVLFLAVFDLIYIVSAFVNLIQSRKLHSPALSAYRLFSLAGALVALFSLQYNLFVVFRFLNDTEQLFSYILGATITLFMIVSGLYLILRGGTNLKRAKRSCASQTGDDSGPDRPAGL